MVLGKNLKEQQAVLMINSLSRHNSILNLVRQYQLCLYHLDIEEI